MKFVLLYVLQRFSFDFPQTSMTDQSMAMHDLQPIPKLKILEKVCCNNEDHLIGLTNMNLQYLLRQYHLYYRNRSLFFRTINSIKYLQGKYRKQFEIHEYRMIYSKNLQDLNMHHNQQTIIYLPKEPKVHPDLQEQHLVI